jgi:hypothetical protein
MHEHAALVGGSAFTLCIASLYYTHEPFRVAVEKWLGQQDDDDQEIRLKRGFQGISDQGFSEKNCCPRPPAVRRSLMINGKDILAPGKVVTE